MLVFYCNYLQEKYVVLELIERPSYIVFMYRNHSTSS